MSANSHKPGHLQLRVGFDRPGAPPASVLFLKSSQTLVQFLTGHRQERLLQRQFHMVSGQRFLYSAQLASELTRFIYFMSSFHAKWILPYRPLAQLAQPTA